MEGHCIGRAWPVGRRHALRAAWFWSVTTVVTSGVGMAATAAASSATVPAKRFEISGGPLAGVLDAFAAEAGVSISYSPKLVAGKTSAGLQGQFEPTAGLAALLADTGLQASAHGAGNYALSAIGTRDAGAKTLEGVTVVGQTVAVGYVAGNSASATKTDTPIFETPQSISVVTRQQIDDQAPQSLNEA